MTRLEEVLGEDAVYARLKADGAPSGEIQKRLDGIGEAVCKKVGPEELCRHNGIIYGETAKTYAAYPDYAYISDALLTFMAYLPDRAHVLDVGCGFGRDAVFMALRDRELRKMFMMGHKKNGKSTIDRFAPPEKAFHVDCVDGAGEMMWEAKKFALKYGFGSESGIPNGAPSSVRFMGCMDIHRPRLDRLRIYDGLWSSTALFMHTPEAMMRPAIEGVAALLKKDGVFGVTYAHNTKCVPHDNLRYSRTGEIKYFSRPLPWEIITYAEAVGFVHCEEEFSDRVVDGKVQKNFFITQFFEKQRV